MVGVGDYRRFALGGASTTVAIFEANLPRRALLLLGEDSRSEVIQTMIAHQQRAEKTGLRQTARQICSTANYISTAGEEPNADAEGARRPRLVLGDIEQHANARAHSARVQPRCMSSHSNSSVGKYALDECVTSTRLGRMCAAFNRDMPTRHAAQSDFHSDGSSSSTFGSNCNLPLRIQYLTDALRQD